MSLAHRISKRQWTCATKKEPPWLCASFPTRIATSACRSCRSSITAATCRSSPAKHWPRRQSCFTRSPNDCGLPCRYCGSVAQDWDVNPKRFFGELRRRNVYKVAIAYGVVAWLLMQVAGQIFPFFEIPNWAVRLVVLLLIIGFPIALVLAWAFEVTPEGIKRAEDVDLSTSVRRKTGRKLDFFIIAVLLLVISILLFQRLHPNVSPAVSSSLDKSIAVLPFDNLSRDPDNAYFSDGIQDEILTKLAGIGDLKVISRKSTAKYKSTPEDLKTVARELGVASVLAG